MMKCLPVASGWEQMNAKSFTNKIFLMTLLTGMFATPTAPVAAGTNPNQDGWQSMQGHRDYQAARGRRTHDQRPVVLKFLICGLICTGGHAPGLQPGWVIPLSFARLNLDQERYAGRKGHADFRSLHI